MTIFEAQSTLFAHFMENDVLKFKEIKNVFLTIGEENVENEIVKLALLDLEKREIVSKFLIANATDVAWVLNKPLQQYEQQVALSPLTAQTIARVINTECEKHGDKANLCNPVAIQDKDIQNILKLLFTPSEDDMEIEEE